MAVIRSARLNLAVSLCVAVLICMLWFGGCTESASPAPNMHPVLDSPEHELQKTTTRSPTAKTLFAMADILATQGRDAECEFVLKRIIRENPKFLPAYNGLAELQMRQGSPNAGIETIQKALRISSEDPVLLNNLGVCWIARGDYEKALEMFTRAAGVMPENARYRANMAVALGLMGRYEESLSMFKRVLPEDQANHNLSVLREARKIAKRPPAASFETPDLQEPTE